MPWKRYDCPSQGKSPEKRSTQQGTRRLRWPGPSYTQKLSDILFGNASKAPIGRWSKTSSFSGAWGICGGQKKLLEHLERGWVSLGVFALQWRGRSRQVGPLTPQMVETALENFGTRSWWSRLQDCFRRGKNNGFARKRPYDMILTFREHIPPRARIARSLFVPDAKERLKKRGAGRFFSYDTAGQYNPGDQLCYTPHGQGSADPD